MRKMYSKKQIKGMVNDSFKDNNEAFLDGVIACVDYDVNEVADKATTFGELIHQVDENSERVFKVYELDFTDDESNSISIKNILATETPSTFAEFKSLVSNGKVLIGDGNDSFTIGSAVLHPIKFLFVGSDLTLFAIDESTMSLSLINIVGFEE